MLSVLRGQERGRPERSRQTLPAGVATGLAWTESGGDVLYVEASLLKGQSGLKLTGQLGKVMKESARAALSYVWAHAEELGIEPRQLRDNGVHIHVPAGAVPKDGPSAGVALVTALASLYCGVPVSAETAMTGEITLSGLVLRVGGIKEKVLAARRAGVKKVVLPRDKRAGPARPAGERACRVGHHPGRARRGRAARDAAGARQRPEVTYESRKRERRNSSRKRQRQKGENRR